MIQKVETITKFKSFWKESSKFGLKIYNFLFECLTVKLYIQSYIKHYRAMDEFFVLIFLF